MKRESDKCQEQRNRADRRGKEKRGVRSGGGGGGGEVRRKWYSKICLLGSAKETTGSFSVRQLYWLPARAQVGNVNVLSLPHTWELKICTCTWLNADTHMHWCCTVPACLHTCTESVHTHNASNKTNTGKNLLSLSNVKDAKAKMSTCLSSLSFISLIPLQSHVQEKA